MRSVLIAVSLLHLIYLTRCTPQECIDLTGKNQLFCLTSELLSKSSSTGLVVSNDGKAYVQDSALAAIVFSQTGHTDISKQICSTFLQLIESNGKINSAYDPTTLAPANNIISTTDMAFTALALARINIVTGDARYLTGATQILTYIEKNLQDSGACFSAGTDADPRSMEQNVVVYAAARFISIMDMVDDKFKSMMNTAKKCIDASKNAAYADFDFLKQMSTKSSSWFALAVDAKDSINAVMKNSQYLGVEITKSAAAVNPELSASMAMALYKYNKDNTAFFKHSLGATLKSSSVRNSAWVSLMLLYTTGDKYANPFADNPSNASPLLPREQAPDQSQSYSRIGLIIGLVTSSLLCVVIVALAVGVLVARRALTKMPKPVKIRSKPNVQLIDMRAVGSPLTPVDDSNVYSPSTPGDVLSPYSPSTFEPYHIVSPGAAPGEETRVVSPFI